MPFCRYYLAIPEIRTRLPNLLVWIVLSIAAGLPASYLAAQNADSLRWVQTLPVPARFATADNLGNKYLLTADKALEKYASDGRLLARYTNNRLGNPSAVDVSNPLKVLLWYADFRQVVFLDRSLTLLGELPLLNTDYPEVRILSSAQDGNLWIYDEAAFKLRKITPEGTLLYESQSLNLLFPDRLNLTCLRDDGSRLFASDSIQGVLAFDAYAQFINLLPFKGVQNFEVVDNRLLYLQGAALRIEHLQVLLSQQIKLPLVATLADNRCWLAGRYLLVSDGQAVQIFGF